MATRELMTSDYFRAIADDGSHVVRLVRTATSYPTVETIEQTFAAINGAVAGLGRDWALLIDSRDGPLRNDPAFEELLGRVQGRNVQRFASAAVLVKSAVGRLQVERYAREDRGSPRVFGDEREAITYLTAQRAGSKP